MNQKLKLGILLDSFNVPAWEHRVIEQILNGNSGRFVLVILNDEKGKPENTKRIASFYSIFNQIDKKIFTKQPDPFSQKNVEKFFRDVPVIKAVTKKNGAISFFSEADADIIRKYQLDVLVKFGFDGLLLETLNAAKYGTWFYCHGDDRIMKGGPPGFWEVVEDWAETGTALLSVGGRFSPNRVLFRSHFLTYPLSPARQRSYYFWATTSFLPRQIDLLHRLGEERFYKETNKYNTALLRDIRRIEEPSNILTLKAIAKISVRLLKELFQRIFYHYPWLLLFSLTNEYPNNFREFKKLQPPKDCFWADPHIIQENGKYFIFIEEFSWGINKGHISVIEMDESGNWKKPVKILEKNYHLSYPFTFEWDGKYYMVPESRANRTIDLYECIEFPHKWVFKQNLMDNVSAVDSTMIHHAGMWWLFTAMAENEASAPNVELFLFYKENLFKGEWKAHLQNPIISDVKSARPAGSIFSHENRLYRPSQDCSKAYGNGFDLNEIVVLTENEYHERRVLSVRPEWDKYLSATHTYAKKGNLTVIDALTRIPKIPSISHLFNVNKSVSQTVEES
jgi:hypothetical protein